MTPRPDNDPPELLEELDEPACRRLLAAMRYGRLAVIHGDMPRIVVLNYLFRRSDLFFRTKPDTLLTQLTAVGAAVPAEFEVDDALSTERAGWSVIAKGSLAREVDEQLVATARSEISAWAKGERDTVLRLRVEKLTGRQVGRL